MERTLTFSESIRRSRYSQTGVDAFALTFVVYFIYIILFTFNKNPPEIIKSKFLFFNIISIGPWFHYITTEYFLRDPTQRKNTLFNRTTQPRRTQEIGRLNSFFSIQTILYFSAYWFLIENYLSLFLILVVISACIEISCLLYISNQVKYTLDIFQEKLTKYIYLKIILIAINFIAELVFFAILPKLNDNPGVFFVLILIPLCSVMAMIFVSRAEKYSHELTIAGIYEYALHYREDKTPVSKFLTSIPNNLIKQKQQTDIAYAALITATALFYIPITILININGPKYFLIKLIGGTFVLTVIILLIITLSSISKIRDMTRFQLYTFQKAMDQLEVTNKKYLDLIGEK